MIVSSNLWYVTSPPLSTICLNPPIGFLQVGTHLYRTQPQSSEGALSFIRSHIVSNETLALIAQDNNALDISSLILHKMPTSAHIPTKVFSDVFEALIGKLQSLLQKRNTILMMLFLKKGAIFLDKGLAEPMEVDSEFGCGCGTDVFSCFIHKFLLSSPHVENQSFDREEIEPKGCWMNYCQRNRLFAEYKVTLPLSFPIVSLRVFICLAYYRFCMTMVM